MSSVNVPGLDEAPTRNRKLIDWVREMAELTQPDRVYWCDGSDAEWNRLTAELVDAGTLRPLNPRSARIPSTPPPIRRDVARVESRTFICSEKQDDAGPTNNWVDPAEMRATLNGLFDGCMRGRTMYVVPFCMGPLGSKISALGVEITDSAYVAISMRVMTRMGKAALDASARTASSCRPSTRWARRWPPGQADVPWPCNDDKWIVHYPRDAARSGPTARATAATPCWARSATRCASPR